MTEKDILQRIQEIKETVNEHDNEMAHSLEDDLYREFIEYLASIEEVDKDVHTKARLILATRLLDFPRWCA